MNEPDPINYSNTKPFKKLNHQQRLFVEHFIGHGSAEEAARHAGYAESTVARSRMLLENPKIAAGIRIARECQINRTKIGSDEVMIELGMIGFFNFKELFDDAGQLIPIEVISDKCGHVIASITEKIDVALNVTTTVKLHSKMDALKMIAQHLGMLVDRKEISGPDGGPVEIAIPAEMTVDEWEKKFG